MLVGSPHSLTPTEAPTPRTTRRGKDAPTNTTRSHRPRTTTHELWRLHGATDELRGLAVETSFGYALALELGREIILLHLQPDLDTLATCAERIERNLLAHGWQRATIARTTPRTPPTPDTPRQVPASRARRSRS